MFRISHQQATNPNSESDDEQNQHQTLADKKKQIKDLNRKAVKKLQKTKAFRRQVQISRDKSRKKANKKRLKRK